MQRSFVVSAICAVAIAAAISGVSANSGPIGPPGGGFPKVRWCVKPGALQHCKDFLPLIDVSTTLAGIFIGTFDDIVECVEFDNCDAPDGPLITGDAEIGSDIDAGKLFELLETGKLITLIASEDEGDVVGEPADVRGYYGTPIVPKGSPLCDAPTVIDALSGARTCHTGFQRTAGWKIPVGNLVDFEDFPAVCDYCGGDHAAASLAALVGSSCVPGAAGLGGVSGINETLCANCAGVGEDFCSQNEPYSGYQGAFRCLVEDSGDVAFIRQTTVDTYSGDNTPDWATGEINRDDFAILCKEGGCADLDDFESCNWAQTIFHTTILAFDFPQSGMVEVLRAGLLAASSSPAVQEYFNGGSKQGILFDPGTTKLVRIDEPAETYAEALFNAFEELEVVDDGLNCDKLKWCIEPENLAVCSEMLAVANLTDTIECFASDKCQSVDGPLVTGEAQIASDVDGGPYFELFRTANLQPVVSEDEGDVVGEPADIVGYYAIATVPKGSPLCEAANIGEAIEGKRTCHTGYQKTAGWRIPVGTLFRLGYLPKVIDNDRPNDLASVENFVSSACIPGAVPLDEFSDTLCANCIGDVGDDFCGFDIDPYSDYEGSFRCMAAGDGDVAFIRQSTIPLFSGPNTPPEWGLGELNPDDYEILCETGGCVPIDQFETCALAQTLFHSTIINQCVAPEQVMEIQQKLHDASTNPDFAKFLKGGEFAGVMFEDGTTKLVPVMEDGAAYGGELFGAFEGLDELNQETCSDICGDITNDNATTILDAIALTAFILGNDDQIGCILESGDIFTDEVFNVQDIIPLTQFIVGLVETLGEC